MARPSATRQRLALRLTTTARPSTPGVHGVGGVRYRVGSHARRREWPEQLEDERDAWLEDRASEYAGWLEEDRDFEWEQDVEKRIGHLADDMRSELEVAAAFAWEEMRAGSAARREHLG